MLKNVIATIIGLVVASFVVYLLESLLGHTFFPLPESIDPNDIQSIKDNMHLIPTGAKLFVIFAHFFGIITGMLVAGFISKTSIIPAYIVGGFMLLATAITLFMLPKELWFAASDGVLAIAAFFFGKSLASKHIYGALV